MSAGFLLPCYGPDGDFGSETQRCVAVFQAKHNIPVTGSIDGKTWEKLISYDTYTAG